MHRLTNHTHSKIVKLPTLEGRYALITYCGLFKAHKDDVLATFEDKGAVVEPTFYDVRHLLEYRFPIKANVYLASFRRLYLPYCENASGDLFNRNYNFIDPITGRVDESRFYDGSDGSKWFYKDADTVKAAKLFTKLLEIMVSKSSEARNKQRNVVPQAA